MAATTLPGRLVVGFLRSYAGMASVSVILDGDLLHAATLDGMWSDTSSQVDYKSFALKSLGRAQKRFGSHLHPSVHTVSLRIPAINATDEHDPAPRPAVEGKFKLTYLATC